MSQDPLKLLAGQHVLVVEDEPLIAMDLSEELKAAGAQVIGPAHSVQQALELIQASHLQAAIVDVKLLGEPDFSIADRLMGDGVPFIFTSATTAEERPQRFADVPNCAKPASSQDALLMLAANLG